MELVHVDTDIGGDTDDLCALAMPLGWPGVELAGVTTCTEEGRLRFTFKTAVSVPPLPGYRDYLL